jgi:sulfide:quinone oxidoreductase
MEKNSFDIVVVGGGSAGIATISSILKRRDGLKIAVIEPKEDHYYQPGWTMVGAGVFIAEETHRKEEDLIPNGVTWIKDEVTSFDPEHNKVNLKSGGNVTYDHMIVAPGLMLDWDAVKGLKATLGQNGVTSNYNFETASYTWKLVQNLKGGKAIFTQPPMPIKCAGAPQKAMYLSCSHWLTEGILANTEVEFCNAGPVLFGVADYVPPLMEYVEKYNINLCFGQNLVAVDGENKVATFAVVDGDGKKSQIEKKFDMLHVCPPQRALPFIANSPLAAETGYLAVDPNTLQHIKYKNIFGAGDTIATLNAKTAAAARKHAGVVAENLLSSMDGKELTAYYNGYGSCPLTVEIGKIILAEFGYGGKIMPTFPNWVNNTFKATKRAWFFKASILPKVYWNYMLKGNETYAKPQHKNDG